MSTLDMWQPWIDFWTPTPKPAPTLEPQKKTAGYSVETKFDMKTGVVTIRHEFGW